VSGADGRLGGVLFKIFYCGQNFVEHGQVAAIVDKHSKNSVEVTGTLHGGLAAIEKVFDFVVHSRRQIIS
jgi:hypothetical protein